MKYGQFSPIQTYLHPAHYAGKVRLTHGEKLKVCEQAQGFGFADKKGREFGAEFEVYKTEIHAPVEVQGEVPSYEPGRVWGKPELAGTELFACVVQGTRGGLGFGSSGQTFYSTLAEAVKAGQAYLAKQKKLAAKKKEGGA